MIDGALASVIAGIHASGRQLVLEFTGAGSLALAWLHAVPGSSRTVLEATDRYSSASLTELLGKTPEKSVEPVVAATMANRAYLRACRLGEEDHSHMGVACTATIATDRTKRGDHRCCVAVQDSRGITTRDLVLAKGQRDRDGEEAIIARLVIEAIAAAVEVDFVPGTLLEGEKVEQHVTASPDLVQQLMGKWARWITIEPDGTRKKESHVAGCIYCGSFNPLHFGHEALAAAAERVTGLPVTLEMTAVNADKAPLHRSELERRLDQFHGHRRVVITCAPLFSDKARLFPGCTFVMGIDTAVRLLEPRFYNDSDAQRDQSLKILSDAGCKVLVAGRVEGNSFRTLSEVSIPPAAQGLFSELPESAFRADVSGTALREAK
jgi:hypothetical protein